MPKELDPEVDPIAIAEAWRETIALRRAQSEAMAEALQNAIDASGLLDKGINPLDAAFALENLTAEVIEAMEEGLGFTFDTEEGVKPNPKHPSNWKQRTKAVRV